MPHFLAHAIAIVALNTGALHEMSALLKFEEKLFHAAVEACHDLTLDELFTIRDGLQEMNAPEGAIDFAEAVVLTVIDAKQNARAMN